MHIRSIRIRNFRAIENFEADNLEDFVVIAGPNGCGKSTVLDVIRLVKSAYVTEEWKRWFQEFGINVDRGADFTPLFRDGEGPAEAHLQFELAEDECAFLSDRADNIALAIVLSDNVRRQTVTGDAPVVPPSLSDDRVTELKEEAEKIAAAIRAGLDQSPRFEAGITIGAEPSLTVTPSPVARAAFNCFEPTSLGEIEYHASRRSYARESVNAVRLKLGDRSEERRNRFLYDFENKYKNVKSQLTEEYVASVLRGEEPQDAPLQASIKELFRTFFPGKEFEGVTLASEDDLSFSVLLATGERHDIDELSSGEKEIVYGYLWLRAGTPRHSVILVDEPELHLNPALVQGLTGFYKTHLADALSAQVWVVTHSDAILRQAVRAAGMDVYHMARARSDGSQQAIHIDSQDAVETAVLDLIGDLAAYRPSARIVLVEGRKDTRFDVDVIRRLFPDLAERGNFIPAGNRRTTAGVAARLIEVLEEAGLTGRAVSICDGDLGLSDDPPEDNHLVWPVYEIENFLVDPAVIRAAAMALLRTDPFENDAAVLELLRELAAGLVDRLALVEVRYVLNGELMGSLGLNASPDAVVEGLVRSGAGSKERVQALDLTEARIGSLFEEASAKLREAVASDEFIDRFPGEKLIHALAGRLEIQGEIFRNACLDQAARLGHRPEKMEQTLLAALE